MYIKLSEVVKAAINTGQKSAIVILNEPNLLLACILYRMGIINMPEIEMQTRIIETISAAERGEFDRLFSDRRPIVIPGMNYSSIRIGTFRHYTDKFNEYGMDRDRDLSLSALVNRYLEFGPVEIGLIIAIHLTQVMANGEISRVRASTKHRYEQYKDGKIKKDKLDAIYAKAANIEMAMGDISGIVCPNLLKEMVNDTYFTWIVNDIGEGITDPESQRRKDIRHLHGIFGNLIHDTLFMNDFDVDGAHHLAVQWNATAMSKVTKSLRMVMFTGFWDDRMASIGEGREVWRDLWEGIPEISRDFRDAPARPSSSLQSANNAFFEAMANESSKTPMLSLFTPGADFIKSQMRSPSFGRMIMDPNYNPEKEQAERERKAEERHQRRMAMDPDYNAMVKFREKLHDVLRGYYKVGRDGYAHPFQDEDLNNCSRFYTEEWLKRPKPYPAPSMLAWSLLGMFQQDNNQARMNGVAEEYGVSSSSARFFRCMKIARYVLCQTMQYATLNTSERISSGLHPEFYPENDEGEKIPGMIGKKPQQFMKGHINNMCMRLMHRYSDPKARLVEALEYLPHAVLETNKMLRFQQDNLELALFDE